MTSTTPATPSGAPTPNPLDLLRTRAYIVILCYAALVGVPVAAIAYGFLAAVNKTQTWTFQSLPSDLGYASAPWWWPLPILVLGGLVTALAITYLPGSGGHEPSLGLVVGGPPAPVQIIGVAVAAYVTLSAGAVLGPEAPLIAIGGGLAAWSVHLVKKDAPAQAAMVIGAAGSFAAISTLFGSPLVGAFLLMEISGIGGPTLGVLLVPGLLAAGIGSLIFIGLDSITGLGTFSLAVPSLPPVGTLRFSEFLWAIAIGILGAFAGTGIKAIGRVACRVISPRRLLFTPVAGAIVAAMAILFTQVAHHGTAMVLFSGENALGPLISQSSTWTVGALALLFVCKGVAYAVSLGGFRGGPTFPAIFLGAAGGLAMAHLFHFPTIAGAAMGMGALMVAVLGLPLTSAMLTALLLSSDSAKLMPLIIVAVVVSYVASVRLGPAPAAAAAPVSSA